MRALALILLLAAPLAAQTPSDRFFFSGDGRLSFHHAHLGSDISVRFRRPDGSYDPQALAELQHFFRSRGDNREGRISLRLIELIDFVEQKLQPRRMQLISGYRSPEFNDDLRSAGAMAARASLHTQGLAADILFVGVKLRPAWNRLRELRLGGLGLYQKEGFLHIDTGPPRFWEPQTSKVQEDLSGGNARLFARTDFDRYRDLAGARVQLHGVTKLPLRIAREATVGDGAATVTLEPAEAMNLDGDECLVLLDPSEVYEARVAAVHGEIEGRTRLTLRTCPPRLERTLESFASNEIEVSR